MATKIDAGTRLLASTPVTANDAAVIKRAAAILAANDAGMLVFEDALGLTRLQLKPKRSTDDVIELDAQSLRALAALMSKFPGAKLGITAGKSVTLVWRTPAADESTTDKGVDAESVLGAMLPGVKLKRETARQGDARVSFKADNALAQKIINKATLVAEKQGWDFLGGEEGVYSWQITPTTEFLIDGPNREAMLRGVRK